MGKIGLVLSGGGAKGAYEAGVVKALTEARIKFDAIAGSSVGGLNALLTASGQIDDMVNLWSNLTNKDIFTLNPRLKFRLTFKDILLLIPIISLFWAKRRIIRIITQINQLSFLADSSPLRTLIKKTLDFDKLKEAKSTLILTGTNLQNGHEETFGKTEDGKFFVRDNGREILLDSNDFKELIISFAMATSAIPIAFPPETIAGCQYVDGGVGNNTPLINVIKAGCKDIFTVLLKPPQRTPLDTQFNSLSSIGARSFEILLENTTKEDFKHAEVINTMISSYEKMSRELLSLAKLSGDKNLSPAVQNILNAHYPKYGERKAEIINNYIIQPSTDIDLSLLEFSPDKLYQVVRQGYIDACLMVDKLPSEKLAELKSSST